MSIGTSEDFKGFIWYLKCCKGRLEKYHFDKISEFSNYELDTLYRELECSPCLYSNLDEDDICDIMLHIQDVIIDRFNKVYFDFMEFIEYNGENIYFDINIPKGFQGLCDNLIYNILYQLDCTILDKVCHDYSEVTPDGKCFPGIAIFYRVDKLKLVMNRKITVYIVSEDCRMALQQSGIEFW